MRLYAFLVICPSFTVITAKEHALFLNLFAVSKSNATKSHIGLLSKSIYKNYIHLLYLL